MKNLLMAFAGGFLALVVFFFVIPLALISIVASNAQPHTPSGPMILNVDLRLEYPDQTPNDGLAALFAQESFLDILTKLDAAVTDPDVAGVFLRASEIGVGSSRAEELRAAILKLRAADKFVIAHSQGFFMGGPSAYRAIAAADEIWMQDGTDFNVSGIALETLFFKDLLDKLDVTAEIEAFHEFKNAPNVYKETGYTAPHRLAMQKLGESLWSISLDDMQQDRRGVLKLEGSLRDTLENGPYSAAEALELGLADKLGWPEDAMRYAEGKVKKGHLVDLYEYVPRPAPHNAPVIALVGGEGAIMPGDSGGDMLNPNAASFIASDTISEQIYEAGKDKDVRAIVFRVDSPGGSPTASDQIWNAIEYVQSENKKPVVISMGSVAASGGYYIAMGADSIVASRTTITGSIGVFGGKFAIADGLRKIGVNAERIDIGGPYASVYSSTERLSNAQRDKMISGLQRVYDRFTRLAAEGRGMSQDQLHALAKGRVWTGEDAQARGLIDRTGGLFTAVEVAKELAEIDADARINLRPATPRLTPFETLGEIFGTSTTDARNIAMLGRLVGDARIISALQQVQALETEPRQMAIAPITER